MAFLNKEFLTFHKQIFLNQQEQTFAKLDPKRDTAENQELALASVCQAMLSSNAFLYVD